MSKCKTTEWTLGDDETGVRIQVFRYESGVRGILIEKILNDDLTDVADIQPGMAVEIAAALGPEDDDETAKCPACGTTVDVIGGRLTDHRQVLGDPDCHGSGTDHHETPVEPLADETVGPLEAEPEEADVRAALDRGKEWIASRETVGPLENEVLKALPPPTEKSIWPEIRDAFSLLAREIDKRAEPTVNFSVPISAPALDPPTVTTAKDLRDVLSDVASASKVLARFGKTDEEPEDMVEWSLRLVRSAELRIGALIDLEAAPAVTYMPAYGGGGIKEGDEVAVKGLPDGWRAVACKAPDGSVQDAFHHVLVDDDKDPPDPRDRERCREILEKADEMRPADWRPLVEGDVILEGDGIGEPGEKTWTVARVLSLPAGDFSIVLSGRQSPVPLAKMIESGWSVWR